MKDSAITSGATNDPFEVDKVRARLARSGDFDALRATYAQGAYPELADLSSAALWDNLADYAEVPDFRLRRLRAVAELVAPGTKVLDVGVGWGEIIPMLQERGARDYVGVDFSEKVAATVSKRHPECRFYVGGLEQIREDFDAVLALEVCEHILPSRVSSFLAQVRRLLRDNGQLIVTVPVYENLRAMTLRCPHCGHMHNRMGHVRSYTPELIKAELSLSGLEVTRAFFVYANFDRSLSGFVKRGIVDLGRLVLRMGRTPPLNIIVVARKIQQVRP
jgi:2-polyprenyl-3-methyl-5-hydroxy-6-metoxy-1,4-benzoquinol methylase